jgi:hypothetical protein
VTRPARDRVGANPARPKEGAGHYAGDRQRAAAGAVIAGHRMTGGRLAPAFGSQDRIATQERTFMPIAKRSEHQKHCRGGLILRTSPTKSCGVVHRVIDSEGVTALNGNSSFAQDRSAGSQSMSSMLVLIPPSATLAESYYHDGLAREGPRLPSRKPARHCGGKARPQHPYRTASFGRPFPRQTIHSRFTGYAARQRI